VTFEIAKYLDNSIGALGASLGERHFTAVRDRVEQTQRDDDLVMLDFRGVPTTNASYLKASVFRLLLCGRVAATSDSVLLESGIFPLPVYPVLANLDNDVLTEVSEFFASRSTPILIANLRAGVSAPTHLKQATLEGWIDPSLRETLDLAQQATQVSAPELHQRMPAKGISVTAWNNRLNELWALRLLRRRRAGRRWQYEPIAKRITYGTRIH
jgi:hypothetical protein